MLLEWYLTTWNVLEYVVLNLEKTLVSNLKKKPKCMFEFPLKGFPNPSNSSNSSLKMMLWNYYISTQLKRHV